MTNQTKQTLAWAALALLAVAAAPLLAYRRHRDG